MLIIIIIIVPLAIIIIIIIATTVLIWKNFKAKNKSRPAAVWSSTSTHSTSVQSMAMEISSESDGIEVLPETSATNRTDPLKSGRVFALNFYGMFFDKIPHNDKKRKTELQ